MNQGSGLHEPVGHDGTMFRQVYNPPLHHLMLVICFR